MKLFSTGRRLARFVEAARSDVAAPAELSGALPVRFPSEQAPTSLPPLAAGNGAPSATRSLLFKPWAGLIAAFVLCAAIASYTQRAKNPPPRALRTPAPTDGTASQQALPAVLPAVSLDRTPAPLPTPATPSAVPHARASRVVRARVSAQARESARTSEPSGAAPDSQADAEAALVEAARKVLRADPARTLELTSEHARRFPAGVLALEREALAIHALVLLGRKSEAEARLQLLETAHPQSIHVTRLHRVLSTSPQ